MSSAVDLVAKLRQGDRKTFEEFYGSTYDGLLRFVTSRITAERDAEEIVHDVYLSFLDSLPLFRGASSVTTFLYSIARHEIADYWRKQYAKKAILTVPFMDHLYTEKLYSAAVLNSEIERIYKQLSNEYVIILRLKYEEGMTVGQIAKQLSMSLKATESRLFRARKAFQEAYLALYGK